MGKHKAIHWFRKGLRLHDNPALLKACEQSSEIYPVFVLDPWFAKSPHCRVGVNRWRFLLETLKDLDTSLKSLNLRLYVVKGKPEEEIERLCKEWKITRLTYEIDTEPYAVKRDDLVDSQVKSLGVEVVKCVSHTLYDVHKTVKANGGSTPLTYQKFCSIAAKMGAPAKALSKPSLADLKDVSTPVSPTHNEQYSVPTLSDLGHSESSCGPLLFPGGETEALDRMDMHIKKINWICNFEKPKTSPNSLTPSTTVLSPYLKFGCLSPRLFYHKLKEVYSGKKHSQPPVSLEGQLLWREFFYTVASATPNFNQMEGNSVCRQIPWGDNQQHLTAWKEGKTGFPFIDAVMTQLRQEGWVHHLARHSVACFLTRGDLWISWVEGMKVFEEYLLDADWALNAGNWMWLSASAFFHQYFRVYSPIAFGKKTDQNGDYIRKYIPALKKFPSKWIFEPWSAPRSVQEAAGCVVGKDYPLPIVDHDTARKRNLEKMGAAYNANKVAKGVPLKTPKAIKNQKNKVTEQIKKRKQLSDSDSLSEDDGTGVLLKTPKVIKNQKNKVKEQIKKRRKEISDSDSSEDDGMEPPKKPKK